MTRILLVEDEKLVARDEQQMLETLGYEVVDIASTGNEAVEKALSLKTDLILMDIRLKGEMDGIDAAGKILEQSSVPIIYLTGHSDDETLKRARRTQPYGFITKPFETKLLRSAIETALYKSEMDAKLRESEETFRMVSSTAYEAIIMMENEGNISFWNKAAEKMFGYSEDEALGKNLHRLIVPKEFHETHDAAFPKFKKTGQGDAIDKILELKAIRKNGEVFPIELSLASSKIKNEWIAVGIIRDITERKALEDETRRLATIAKQAVEGIAVADLEGQIQFANNAWATMHGYDSADGLVGESLSIFHTEKQLKTEVIPFNEEAKQRGHNIGEIGHVRKEGTTFSTLMTVALLRDEQGTPYAIAGFAQDITERKNLEHQLSHAQKLESIGQLAAGIAHEINTPTQYVGDNTRFLKDAFDDILKLFVKYQHFLQVAKAGNIDQQLIDELEKMIDETDVAYLLDEAPKAIEQSLEGIGRITHIVRAMKEFSHPGGQEKTRTDINKAIETTITVARNEWEYVAEIKTDFSPDLPMVPCLQDEFNQVILNMITNAAHAIGDVLGDKSSNKGVISITTCMKGEWVEIRVKDTGSGIPEAARDKIFDPFFTTKETGKGTGQGLAISYNVIAKKHGGSLTFKTEEGKGTTFIIRLPVEEPVS